MWDLSSPTRNRTHVPCIGRRIPFLIFFKVSNFIGEKYFIVIKCIYIRNVVEHLLIYWHFLFEELPVNTGIRLVWVRDQTTVKGFILTQIMSGDE